MPEQIYKTYPPRQKFFNEPDFFVAKNESPRHARRRLSLVWVFRRLPGEGLFPVTYTHLTKYRETSPRVAETLAKRDEVHKRFVAAQNANDLNELRQIIVDCEIVCPISGTRHWTEVRDVYKRQSVRWC